MNSLNLWLCAASLSVLLSGSFSSNSSGVCSNSWIYNLGMCYTVGNNARTCYDANLICRAHGGSLVSINSQAENEIIHSLLPDRSGFDCIFCIGFIRDLANPSNWFWLDGSNITYTNWDTNQPESYSEACCVILVENGKWHDYACTSFSSRRSYICEKDADECQSPNVCAADLVCQNTVGSYICGCPLGFDADPESTNPLAPICVDIDECYSPDTCGPDYVCNNTAGSYTCECHLGYVEDHAGSQIDSKAVVCVDFDECQSPGACGSEHVCNNTVGSYTCECPLGYVADSGPQNPLDPVCVDDDECQLPAACGSQHVCNNTVGSYTCQCPLLGFVADSGPQNPLDPVCFDVDECQSLDACGSNHTCNNTVGSYTCECPLGFVKESGSQNPLDPTCVDLDECSDNVHDCAENAKCVNERGSYRCICLDGYTGDGKTCTDIDECVHSPVSLGCSPHSDCINFGGSFFCACWEGYLGDGMTCKKKREVLEMICKDRGGLIDAFDSYGDQRCKCAFGYVYDSGTDKCLRKL